jgi:tetratricopeptide (TPR) repeat protein
VGLLAAYGGGYYRIHPALPWFFRRLYAEYYPDDAPARAYVEALGELSDYYGRQCNEGNRDVIALLKTEEANLLHARRLAQQYGWYHRITSTMQGLFWLYDHTGRRAEWRRLVEEIVPLFVDPATDGPLPGREEQWGFVNDYRVRLLREERQWASAARLQGLKVTYTRQRVAPLLVLPPEQLDTGQRAPLRTFAVDTHQLGQIQREQGDVACVASYQEAMGIFERIGDQAYTATCAFNLGRVYGGNVPALRDLAQAEQWYRRSLELRAEGDRLGRGQTLGMLGHIAYERFQKAQQAGEPESVLLETWNAALQASQQALQMFPPDAVDNLAITYNQIGVIYEKVQGKTEQAVAHYREAIRYFEQAGNLYGAAGTRFNVAVAYANEYRFEDALLFAQAALANYEQFGLAAADRVERARGLVAQIEQAAGGGA